MRNLIEFGGRVVITVVSISYVSTFELESFALVGTFFLMSLWMINPVLNMYYAKRGKSE